MRLQLLGDMPDEHEQKPDCDRDSRRRRLSIRILVGSVLVVWIITVAALLVIARSTPEKSAIDTELEGVKQPSRALNPTKVYKSKTDTAVASLEQPCWPVYGRRPSRTSNAADLAHGVPARKTWSLRVGIMEFPPAYCDGVLYVNNQHGETFAVESKSSRILWRRKTAQIYDSTPAVSGSRIFVGAFKPGSISALDRATGKLLWTLKAGGAVEASPIVVEDTVFATSKDRRVYAINPRTGRVRWVFRTGGELKNSPSYSKGLIYVGNYAAEVFALRATNGKPVWRKALGGVRGDRIYASVAVTDGIAFVATVRGDIYAIDAKSGRIRWTTDIPGYVYTTPTISGGRLFVANYVGEVYAFNALNGRRMWKRKLGGTFSGSPTVIGDLLYVSSLSRQRTWALGVGSGRIRWQYPDGRYVSGIASERAIYLSMGSKLTRWVTSASK